MHYRINFSDKANSDINIIAEYRQGYNVEKIIGKIYEDIENLNFMPRAHKTVLYYANPNGEYRRIVSGKYIIIYKIINNQIIILRIFSQKQNYLNSKNFILREKSNVYKIMK